MIIVDRSWWSLAGPHGGLLGSLAVTAAEHACPDLPMRELNVQFLTPLTTTTAPVALPTVTLSVQYFGVPPGVADMWVLTRIATRAAGDGWCVDDSDLWTEDGQLLAIARQTRRVLQPPAQQQPSPAPVRSESEAGS